jgi:hypothetical protein
MVDTKTIIQDYSIRRQLLEEAINKPIRSFVQVDFFKENTGATSHNGDHDIFAGVALELRHSNCMRLQIPEHFTKDEAIKGLRLMLEWIEGESGPLSGEDSRRDLERLRAKMGIGGELGLRVLLQEGLNLSVIESLQEEEQPF